MGRKRIDRNPIFRMFALNWDKKKIKREAKVSERTYWMVKEEWDQLSEVEKGKIKQLATEEEKAKARFEDYEFVQKWIQKMQSDKIKAWSSRVNECRRIWQLLDKKNPEYWTVDDIKLRAIPKLREGRKTIFTYLVSLRSLRPDFKEEVKTKREKAPINIEWRYAYRQIVQENKILYFFESAKLPFKELNKPELELEAELIIRTHVTVGCREGTKEKGGLLSLEWEKVDWINKTIDVYEGKTGGGFYWLGCPLDLFGDKTFNMLREWHKICGEPKQGKIFPNLIYYGNFKKVYSQDIEPTTKLPYIELIALYHSIGENLNLPIKLMPHFARKLHASLLKRSGITLEIVAGEPPHGIVGVGWEDLTTLKKFYVSFAEEDIAKAKEKGRQLAL